MHMRSAFASAGSGTITIAHPLGRIEVPTDAVMHFSTPLLGFSHSAYALLPAARRGLWWLIATDGTPTTFVLADPFAVIADYAVDLNEREREALSLHDERDALVLVLLVMPAASNEQASGNFRAPLVFNLAARKVQQVMHRDERYGLGEPVDLALYALMPPTGCGSTGAPYSETSEG